ncbi:proline-rich receptor-like protein kinase PERK8 [Iris pallida]|uniref:Proline-rich receptor-like protein kinase PERK8 n=1 Tax=Iris pallida TaxID=29817 RepID=A0AAX6DVR1_IRIPA|nr:proline-rich receptor-like protein kinase PERK8 [Iris pallida]KAJ6825967.1 proline-rich receptor-like protein kinase PERK8 [Iris pallida]
MDWTRIHGSGHGNLCDGGGHMDTGDDMGLLAVVNWRL